MIHVKFEVISHDATKCAVMNLEAAEGVRVEEIAERWLTFTFGRRYGLSNVRLCWWNDYSKRVVRAHRKQQLQEGSWLVADVREREELETKQRVEAEGISRDASRRGVGTHVGQRSTAQGE